jgi:ABC-type dipeptide/oligopeptide/nickel transport system permease subunit
VDPNIPLRHLLPKVITPAIVAATFGINAAIIGEATLLYLGLGIQPPAPTWGKMLADVRVYVGSAWWLVRFPGPGNHGDSPLDQYDWRRQRDSLDPRLRHVG